MPRFNTKEPHMPLPRPLASATQAHLAELVGESEGSHLDFKRELPLLWDYEAKKRFMADVVAFANAGGGDLVFGVQEGPGAVGAGLVPQRFENVDFEVRRVQEFLLDLVEPRLPGTEVIPIPIEHGSEQGHAIVVRVPQSWVGPHRSKVNFHFYVRDGARNRQLDLPEIRSLFLRSDSQAQRLRDFRASRLGTVVTGATPVPLGSGPKLIIHAVPTQAALGQAAIDPLPYFRRQRSLPVLGLNPVARVQLNLDGAFGPIAVSGARPPGYTQHFRHGSFEAVVELSQVEGMDKPFFGGAHEGFVVKFLSSVRKELEHLEMSAELAVFISLLGANHAVYAQDHHVGIGPDEQPFDRADILIPDVVIPTDSSIEAGIKPALDLIAQAAGYEQSSSYGPSGVWKRRT